jgi:peroxiredoxin
MSYAFPLACLVLGALDLMAATSLPAPRHTPDGLAKGVAAPAFRLMDTTGKAVALSDFRGKVVYLDFWFTGCHPCMAEMPALGQLRAQFRGRDVVFVGISIETYVEGWKQTVAAHALGGPGSVQLLDPQGKYATRAYRVQGFPTYMVLGRDGRVLDSNAPRPSDNARVARELEQALAAK